MPFAIFQSIRGYRSGLLQGMRAPGFLGQCEGLLPLREDGSPPNVAEHAVPFARHLLKQRVLRKQLCEQCADQFDHREIQEKQHVQIYQLQQMACRSSANHLKL